MAQVTRIIVALAVVGGAAIRMPAPAHAQLVKSELEGDRYATLRGLAEYVNEGAEFVLQEAIENSGVAEGRDTALVTSLRDFSRRAAALHQRVDRDRARPAVLVTDVSRLQTLARRVNVRLRRERGLQDLYEDWDGVTRDLADMRRVIAGRDVELRAPDREWTDREPRDDRPRDDSTGDRYGRGGFREAVLTRDQMVEFKGLSHDLDTQARKVLDLAERRRADYTGRGDQLLADLRAFVTRTAELHTQSDQGMVRPREVGPNVEQLLTDARAVDQSMRNTRVFETVWNEWAKTIQILESMTAFLR